MISGTTSIVHPKFQLGIEVWGRRWELISTNVSRMEKKKKKKKKKKKLK
jgi:hypothetical protein